MYFDTKSYLKNTHNYTTRHGRSIDHTLYFFKKKKFVDTPQSLFYLRFSDTSFLVHVTFFDTSKAIIYSILVTEQEFVWERGGVYK
jgi:hypothetical protein